MYCVALAVGSVVGAVILSLLKKNRTEVTISHPLLFQVSIAKGPPGKMGGLCISQRCRSLGKPALP